MGVSPRVRTRVYSSSTLQYFGPWMQRTDTLEKTLILGKIEGRRRRGWDGYMASPARWTWVWASSGVGNGQGSLCAAVHGATKCWMQLSKWTELQLFRCLIHLITHAIYTFYNKIFIYLLAALSLCCCVSFLEQRAGASLGCATQVSCCGGFSCYGAWAVGRTGFSS